MSTIQVFDIKDEDIKVINNMLPNHRSGRSNNKITNLIINYPGILPEKYQDLDNIQTIVDKSDLSDCLTVIYYYLSNKLGYDEYHPSVININKANKGGDFIMANCSPNITLARLIINIGPSDENFHICLRLPSTINKDSLTGKNGKVIKKNMKGQNFIIKRNQICLLNNSNYEVRVINHKRMDSNIQRRKSRSPQIRTLISFDIHFSLKETADNEEFMKTKPIKDDKQAKDIAKELSQMLEENSVEN